MRTKSYMLNGELRPLKIGGEIVTDEDIRLATLAAVKKGAKSDAEAVRNYREAERVIRAALPYLLPIAFEDEK